MLFILKIYIIRKKIKNIVNKLQVSYFINKFNINLLIVLLISQFGEKPEKI
jgi:hypothetical protein